MPTNPNLSPEAFELAGGPTGVLLIHGFTGCPAEMRPMGDYLASQGFTVRAPLLPGHGTSPDQLNRVRWSELVDAAGEALESLQGDCEQVFVAGLSMGGLITLRLGQTRSGIAGLIPMSAATYLKNPLRHLIPLAKYFVKTIPKPPPEKEDFQDPSARDLVWCYDVFPMVAMHEVLKLRKVVLGDLEQIEQPVLVLHGVHDSMVPKKAAQAIYDRVRSTDRELVWLEGSGHCVTIDAERELVWTRSSDWIRDRSSAAVASAESASSAGVDGAG